MDGSISVVVMMYISSRFMLNICWLKFLRRSRGINLIAKYFLVGTENCMLIHFVTNNTSCQIECMAPNKKQVIGGKYICIAYGWHNTSVIKAYRVQH